MKSLAKLGRLLLCLVMILLLAGVAAAYGLLHDEALRPEVPPELKTAQAPVPPEDNLFYAGLAFDMLDTPSLNQSGQALFAEYLEARRSKPGAVFDFENGRYDEPGAPGAYFETEAERHRLDVPAKPYPGCGHWGDHEDCIDNAAAHPAEMAKAVDDNRLLLDRYTAILDYPHFQNPDALIGRPEHADWNSIPLGQQLYLSGLALRFGRGDNDAVTGLRDELAFNRRMLAQPGLDLYDKQVLVHDLRESLLFTAELLRRGPLKADQYAALHLILPPLSRDERSLDFAYRRLLQNFVIHPQRGIDALQGGEWQGLRQLLRHPPAAFYKRDASWNFFQARTAELKQIAVAPCRDLEQGSQRMAAALRIDRLLPDLFYDGAGKLLAKMYLNSQEAAGLPLIRSICELQALHHLVALQLMIREHGEHDVPALLRDAGPDYADPFTGEPFIWDAQDHALELGGSTPGAKPYAPWVI
jgi:hypothetical protein